MASVAHHAPVADNHEAHDYAERIRDRLPRRLQELREGCGLSMDALWMKGGVSRASSQNLLDKFSGGFGVDKVNVGH